MKRIQTAIFIFVVAGAWTFCSGGQFASDDLAEARKTFHTKLIRQEATNIPAEEPPQDLFRLDHYESPAGYLAAYTGIDPGDRKKHPAIIWLTGGFDNSIGNISWTPQPPDNDQSVAAFRKVGIVMMYPSLRGGNDNPGFKEAFCGEVDDVLAAADFLAKQSYVDPKRIYLGGHSTGGTLVMLVAECTPRFRAVFAFGAAANVAGYGQDILPFDIKNLQEVQIRSPRHWLTSIRSPIFLFEGANQPSNLSSLELMARVNTNPLLQTFPVKGANHFSILGPVTKVIAEKIVHDDGPKMHITFNDDELNKLFDR